MDEGNLKWQTFIQDNLLKTGFIDGFILFTLELEPVYKYGSLEKLRKEDYPKFKDIFESLYDDKCKKHVLETGLTINVDGKDRKLVVRQLQHSSACAVSKGNEFGIVAVKFAFGFIVAAHKYPISSPVALHHVQDVVVMLCS